jgi:Histidine kinase
MRSFFYSNKLAPRLARHLAFWTGYFLSTLLTYLPDIRNWSHAGRGTFARAFKDAIAYLPPFLLAVYSAIYLVLPIYLKKRKLSLLLCYWLMLLAITVPIGYLITESSYMQQGFDSDALDILATAMHVCFGNLTTFMVAAVCIKIMKDYWLRQRENELLAIENIRNKLHLLKMQLHPRILFASLQRIYFEIEQGTREAPEMILKLSDLLSYLLYESEAEKVPLGKEVQMIENYLALKKLEYKSNFSIRIETRNSSNNIGIGKSPGEADDHWISPGLFLPLLETSIERANAIAQMTTVAVQLKTIGPLIMFSLKTDVSGKTLAKDPAFQTAIRMVKERLSSSGLKRWKLDLLTGAGNTTIVMQLEKPPTPDR